MNQADQDRQTSSLTPIPSPTSGAGSSELTTASDDPAVLRGLLERARERLVFYESYDRIIGENIRRTGELMLDSIAVRDQARTQSKQMENARAELEARVAANQQRHQALLHSLVDEFGALHSGFDLLQTRLRAALAESGPDVSATVEDSSPTPEPASPVIPVTDATTEAMEAGREPLPPSSEATTTVPLQIDVIAQGVAKAITALSLQRYLGELDAVIAVEAREFAEGILRLQVTANRSLSANDLAGWSEGRGLRVSQEQPRILEIELSPNAA